MDREEFEQQYAERSGITRDELHNIGRVAIPCDCGEEICEGWQMIQQDGDGTLLDLAIFYRLKSNEAASAGYLSLQSYMMGYSDGILKALREMDVE